MRRIFVLVSAIVALAANASPAVAAKPLFVGCSYQDPASGRVVASRLFTVGEEAIYEGRGVFTHDKIVDWEAQFPPPKNNVRPIGSYKLSNLVGQFHQLAATRGDSNANCWVTTERARAALWYADLDAHGQVDVISIQDWRPSGVRFSSVSDWAGRIVEQGSALAAASAATTKVSGASDMPTRPKKSNAEADAEYAAAMEVYNRQLAEQQAAVAEFEQKQKRLAETKVAQSMAVTEASSDYQKRLADHDAQVQAQQLEYKKQVARPAGIANAVYRGFGGASCDAAQRAAKGSSGGSNFVPVATKRSAGTCTVEGWWWNS